MIIGCARKDHRVDRHAEQVPPSDTMITAPGACKIIVLIGTLTGCAGVTR
jgi:hypothetical protein